MRWWAESCTGLKASRIWKNFQISIFKIAFAFIELPIPIKLTLQCPIFQRKSVVRDFSTNDSKTFSFRLSSSQNGFYNITVGTITWNTWCKMDGICGCGDGAWTRVMRVNGSMVQSFIISFNRILQYPNEYHDHVVYMAKKKINKWVNKLGCLLSRQDYGYY